MLTRNNKESAFTISRLPENINEDDISEASKRHAYKEIIIIYSGKGSHRIDGEVLNLTRNTLYFIKINQIHQFIKGVKLKGYSIKYKNEFIPTAGLTYRSGFYSKLNGYLSDLKQIKFKKSGIKTLKSHFEVLLEEYHQPEDAFTSKAIVQYLFISFILKIERKARDIVVSNAAIKTDNHSKDTYTNFLNLLEDNFMTHHNMEFYADKLMMPRRKLSDLIKDYNGITAKKFLLNRVILEAKRLLAYSNKNLKEICFDLGFNNPAYFSTLFKEITGHTPNAYRKIQQLK